MPHAFWIIFLTLMLQVEVRIFPSYKVVSDLHMLNTFWALFLPSMANGFFILGWGAQTKRD